jgi:hypothetical protein
MKTSKFYVSVDGRSAPTVPHVALQEAYVEATRLSLKAENKQATVRVFAEVIELLPTVTHHVTSYQVPEELMTIPGFPYDL